MDVGSSWNKTSISLLLEKEAVQKSCWLKEQNEIISLLLLSKPLDKPLTADGLDPRGVLTPKC